jgi:cytochrome c556
MMKSGAESVQSLESMIVDGASAERLSAQFEIVTASCTDCHRVYRDKR